MLIAWLRYVRNWRNVNWFNWLYVLRFMLRESNLMEHVYQNTVQIDVVIKHWFIFQGLTRVNTVAGDISTFQPLSQLMREENIAKLAVAVGLKELPAVSPTTQVFAGDQCIEVDLAPLMSHRGQGDHTASGALLKPVQQEARQQEMAKMVDTKLDTKPIFSSTVRYKTWRRNSVLSFNNCWNLVAT